MIQNTFYKINFQDYKMTSRDSLNLYFQDAVRNYWELPALTDFGGATMSYKDVARKIAKLHLLYEKSGIKPGDKVALCAKNSSMWLSLIHI